MKIISRLGLKIILSVWVLFTFGLCHCFADECDWIGGSSSNLFGLEDGDVVDWFHSFVDNFNWMGDNSSSLSRSEDDEEGNQWNVAANWKQKKVPDAGDTAIFSDSSKIVELSRKEGQDPELKVKGFLFNGGKNFGFAISKKYTISFQNDGVKNAGTGSVAFNLNEKSIVDFLNDSHADSEFSGRVAYNINHSTLNFRDHSCADNAVIHCSSGGVVEFQGKASACQSTIHLSNPKDIIRFSENSNAGSAIINASLGEVIFADTSDAQSAQFNLSNGCELKFLDSASGGKANVHLSTKAKLSLSQNNTLGSLITDQETRVILGDFHLMVGSNNNSDILDGQLEGSKQSQFIKVGKGILCLNGNSSTFEGETFVKSGTMILNNILGGNISVNESGTLSGSGTVLNSVTVDEGGSLALDENISTLHIKGNYVQNENAMCRLKINQAGESSLIHAEGTATLNGGKIEFNETDGYCLCLPYKILHAEEGVQGEFTSPPFSKLLLKQTFAYQNNAVYMRIGPDLVNPDLTSNQLCVAEQIESINDLNPDKIEVVKNLVSLSKKEIPNILDLISGEQYANLIIADQRATRRFLQRIYNPLRFISLDQDCDELCYSECKAWTDIGGGKSFQSGSKGYEMDEFNFSAAIHRSLNDWLADCMPLRKIVPCSWLTGWTVGFAATYASQEFEFQPRGRMHMHNTEGALYALLTESWCYFLSDLIIGYTTGELERPIKFCQIDDKAKSNPNIFQTSYYGEFGINNIYCWNIAVQPYFGIETGCYNLSGIKENGARALDLKINDHEANLTNSYLGVHLYQLFESNCSWGFSADLAWVHLFDFDNNLNERFVHFGDKFKVEGPKIDRNGFQGALSFFKVFNDCWLVSAEFLGEKWANYSNVYFSASVTLRW